MRFVGIIAVLGAAAIWAIEPIVARFIGSSLSFDQMLFSRALGCVVISALVLFVRRTPFRVTSREGRALVLIGFLGSFVSDFLYFVAILFLKTPVVNAVLIAHLQPVFILILGHWIFHEGKFSFWDYGGIVAMLFSGILVMSGSLKNLLSWRFGGAGDYLVLVATVFWALSGILAKKYLQNRSSALITLYRFFVSLPFYGITAFLLSRAISLSVSSLLFGGMIGIGYFLYYEGLKRLKTAQAAALELAAPVFATAFGYIFFQETVSLLKWIGIGLLFVGIGCFGRAARMHERETVEELP
jgi:drug/metabolite transporter (DMT)-like permease